MGDTGEFKQTLQRALCEPHSSFKSHLTASLNTLELLHLNYDELAAVKLIDEQSLTVLLYYSLRLKTHGITEWA